MILTSMARFVEQLVRLMRCQALVPKVNRQPGQFPKLLRQKPALLPLACSLLRSSFRGLPTTIPATREATAEARD